MISLNSSQIAQTRELAQRAATCALSFYDDGIEVTLKSDRSPVTQADLAVSALLEQQLPTIADFPVLSEENQPDTPLWTTWETYWLIDPIDGTKHFINRTGDFCICIALIHQNQAVFGLIIAPTTGQLWLAQQGNSGSPILEKYIDNKQVDFPVASPLEQFTVVLSSIAVSKRMANFLSVLPPYQWYGRGSALKYIEVAEGKAMLYPKIWDTCEWDSAAGQCILACAGGEVARLDTGEVLRYGEKNSLLNPHFIAYRHVSDKCISALRKHWVEGKFF